MNVEEKGLLKSQQVYIMHKVVTVKLKGATDNMENLILVDEII